MWSRLSSLLICTRGLVTKERKELKEKIILPVIILLKIGHEKA
jgi:hypothetical protein